MRLGARKSSRIIACGRLLWIGWSVLAVAMPASAQTAATDQTKSVASDISASQRAAEDIQRGNAAGYRGQFDQAIAEFTRAIAIQADSVSYLGRGLAYLQKARFDAAIADFSQAIVLKPDSFDAYQSRGVAYDQKGLYDKAIDDYTQAIALQPKVAQVFFNRGAANEHHRLYQKAALDYRAALRLDPTLQSAKDGLKRMGTKP